MDKDLKALYEQWGYDSRALSKVPASWTISRVPPATKTSKRSAKKVKTVPRKTILTELPPLDENGAKRLREIYNQDPQMVIKKLNQLLGEEISHTEFDSLLSKAERISVEPQKSLRAAKAVAKGQYNWDAYEKFLVDAPLVKQTIDDHSFEKSDPGWIFLAGGPWLLWLLDHRIGIDIRKHEFVYHRQIDDFVFDMKDAQNKNLNNRDVSIGLFADFGTGLYHSLAIAHHIIARQPDYAIHLGDVYFAGRKHEVQQYLDTPLHALTKTSRVFVMNSNHEMLSGGTHYFRYIERKHQRKAQVPQEQTSSYFCLRTDGFQIVALDTAYHQDGRMKDAKQAQWFKRRMEEATQRGLRTILLTPNEPYDLGALGLKDLFYDVMQGVGFGKIAIWFWGNTHYCALYDPQSPADFFGSCIGHAGYPIKTDSLRKTERRHRKLPANTAFKPKLRWVDTAARFFNEDIRPDLANSGYCMIRLIKQTQQIEVDYFDWMNRPEPDGARNRIVI